MFQVMFLALAVAAPPNDAEVMKAFADCSRVCADCERHCRHHGDKHARSCAACHDCALMCKAASEIYLREGALASIARTAAMQACLACAKECEKLIDDEMMAMCAKTCRDCVNKCAEPIRAPKEKKCCTCRTRSYVSCSAGGRKHRLRNLLGRLFHRRRC